MGNLNCFTRAQRTTENNSKRQEEVTQSDSEYEIDSTMYSDGIFSEMSFTKMVKPAESKEVQLLSKQSSHAGPCKLHNEPSATSRLYKGPCNSPSSQEVEWPELIAAQVHQKSNTGVPAAVSENDDEFILSGADFSADNSHTTLKKKQAAGS